MLELPKLQISEHSVYSIFTRKSHKDLISIHECATELLWCTSLYVIDGQFSGDLCSNYTVDKSDNKGNL